MNGNENAVTPIMMFTRRLGIPRNVRVEEVTDVSTQTSSTSSLRLQGCPSRVSSFRFLPLVREEAGALHVGQAHRRVIQDRQLRHRVAFFTSLDSQAGVR